MKIIALRLITWSYNCLVGIIIISYLKPYIIALQIIGIRQDYLKQYNYMQTNYYWIRIVILNDIIVNK